MLTNFKEYILPYEDLSLLVRDFIFKEKSLEIFCTKYPDFEYTMEIQIQKSNYIMYIKTWINGGNNTNLE